MNDRARLHDENGPGHHPDVLEGVADNADEIGAQAGRNCPSIGSIAYGSSIDGGRPECARWRRTERGQPGDVEREAAMHAVGAHGNANARVEDTAPCLADARPDLEELALDLRTLRVTSQNAGRMILDGKRANDRERPPGRLLDHPLIEE